MILDEQFDADEVLRNVDELYDDDEDDEKIDEMRELNFGNRYDEQENFNDMASDIDNTEDMWE